MRTVSVRLSLAEHRLLHDLAGARSTSIEALLREALGFPPLHAPPPHRRWLEVVRAEDDREADDDEPGPPKPPA